MATDKSDKQGADSPKGEGSGGMSMKDRLLAQRRAEGQGAPAGAPPVPAARPASSAPRAPAAPAAPARPAPDEAPKRPVKLAAQKNEERQESATRRSRQASPEVMREVEMLRKAQDKWITYGWIVAAVLMAIAGTVYFVVTSKRAREEEARATYEKSVNDFVERVQKLDTTKEPDANKVLELTNDAANDTYWKDTYVDGAKQKVQTQISKAKTNLDRIKETRELQQGLQSIEDGARNAGSLKPDDLAQLLRKVKDYEFKADSVGPEFKERVIKARVEIDRAYVSRLHEEAKALAAKGPAEARAALTLYTKAEDEVVSRLDDAAKRKREEEKTYYIGHLKDIIAESDALVYALFTPDVVDKTTAVDLLSGEPLKGWQNDGFKGWQVKDGVLHAVGKDPGASVSGIMSVGDREQWRDFAIDVEFVLVKGSANFFFRLGKRADNTSETFSVSTVGEAPFKANTPYAFTAKYIGSKFEATFADPDRAGFVDEARWTMIRKGAFGLTVPEGSEIKITKAKIRVLR